MAAEDLDEVEYVDECPSCGVQFLGMTPEEFRETHATTECPKAPIPQLFVFPTEEAKRELETGG